jgi:hypothetical protein
VTIYSRLPAELTLDQRVAEINRLCGKLNDRGAQIERLRWRIAIELYAVQQMVLAQGLPWEAWCQEHISRSAGDIRKLIKMAASHNPEAAHQAEKTDTRAHVARHRQKQKGSNVDQRAYMRVADTKRSAEIARQLITALMVTHPISEVRAMLSAVEMHDLFAALNAAEASASGRAVRAVSTISR